MRVRIDNGVFSSSSDMDRRVAVMEKINGICRQSAGCTRGYLIIYKAGEYMIRQKAGVHGLAVMKCGEKRDCWCGRA